MSAWFLSLVLIEGAYFYVWNQLHHVTVLHGSTPPSCLCSIASALIIFSIFKFLDGIRAPDIHIKASTWHLSLQWRVCKQTRGLISGDLRLIIRLTAFTLWHFNTIDIYACEKQLAAGGRVGRENIPLSFGSDRKKGSAAISDQGMIWMRNSWRWAMAGLWRQRPE